ncbi:MAG: hypothetical protein AB1425_11420, partial [Actinomycetota bacterium]
MDCAPRAGRLHAGSFPGRQTGRAGTAASDETSAENVFRFAAAGHRLTVTHADGQPVEPVTVEALRIGMGERYDAILE